MKSICCGGRPLVIIVDDLQWADDFALEMVEAFTSSLSTTVMSNVQCSGGLLMLGSYRDNEVDPDGFLKKLIPRMSQAKGNLRVAELPVKELLESDINSMLSSKLCLPMRYTRHLAKLVHKKTRGNPYHIEEFLVSVISNNMLRFSVKERRWTWDDEVIDLQMISEGVAELLARKLRQLPKDILQTLKICSCLGSQVNRSTIRRLDSGNLPFSLLESLDAAVNEGLMEKAFHLYRFVHDILKESVYNLIPESGRMNLHKKLGLTLIKYSEDISEVASIAVDQINVCKDHVDLSMEERSLFAQLNLNEGKKSTAMSSFAQARDYVEAGISFLSESNWTNQYMLSLELFELSVEICFMDGNTSSVLSRLNQILSNATSFEDTLNARSFLMNLLAASGKYEDAIAQCIGVLSNLGEVFPSDISSDDGMKVIENSRALLRGITKDQFMLLPKMTNPLKLKTMKFLALLCSYSHVSRTSLIPLVSYRMVELTLHFGFTDDSVVGIAMLGYSFTTATNDIREGYRITKIATLIIEEESSINEHTLRAKLARFPLGQGRYCVEPFQSNRLYYIDMYKSCMATGDVER